MRDPNDVPGLSPALRRGPTLTITLPESGRKLVFAHQQVFWFAREIIDWRDANLVADPQSDPGDENDYGGARRIYLDAIVEAERKFRKDKLAFKEIEFGRLKNLISRGHERLHEHEIWFL